MFLNIATESVFGRPKASAHYKGTMRPRCLSRALIMLLLPAWGSKQIPSEELLFAPNSRHPGNLLAMSPLQRARGSLCAHDEVPLSS